jgi:predicted regulator of Ras-like GTPase activity (Roadblock/LC7/MglB family)
MSSADLTWLLNDLTTRVPHVEQVVMLSRDGLAVAASSSLSREEVERLAAIAAGFQGLGRGAAGYLAGGEVRQVIVEMSGKYLFVAAAGEFGCLAVLATVLAEVGQVAYEMALLAQRVGTFLPGPRRAVYDGRTRT